MTYRDKNDRLVVVLEVDDDDEISSRLSAYHNDDSQNIGDCHLNGYVKTGRTLASMSSDLKGYYNKALDNYGPALGEYIAAPDHTIFFS